VHPIQGGKRVQGPPWYYQRVSLAEQNDRLWERLRRKSFDLEHEQAGKHELEQENERLREENSNLHRENHELREENARLKLMHRPAWIKPNLHPSNPTRSTVQESAPEREKKAKKKIGAKFGHPAHKRTVPTHIDRHVNLVADHCPSCQRKLSHPNQWHTHTQIDLPEFSPLITTQYHIGWSHCAHCHQSVSIHEKLHRSKYGPRLHACIGYWKFGLGLTLPKIQGFLKTQNGLEISTGELSEILASDAAKFEACYESLKPSLRKEGYVCADETGWRKGGNNAWLWSFSSPKLSYYTIERGRSRHVVMDTLGKKWDGILSSDFLGSYSAIECEKQKCWVHLLRELREDREKYPDNEEVLRFSRRTRQLYERAKKLSDRVKSHQKIHPAYERLLADTDRFIQAPWKHPEMKTLANRLLIHREALFTFILNPEVDSTNNAAEREIRPAVLMRKTSYGNRSDRGAKTQAIWMSLIRTCQKQGKPFIQTAAQFFKSA
jgi:transposase